MVEENKKPNRIIPGQVVIGDDPIDVERTSDLPESSDKFDDGATGFDAEATRAEEEARPVIAPKATSLGSNIEPGVVIGNRYRLVYLAGAGATGQVWHAYDMHMGYGVAIKLISPKFQKDPEVLDRFRDSFKVVHDLHHRYICPLNHMGNDERFGWYLVMQWMPETLSSFRESLEARKQSMSQEMIRTIISMLAEGLDYVHELRIIHRDIKPANIVITRNQTGDFNTAQLIDFGLSQDLDQADDDTIACGTPAYMAPEQWSNSLQDGKTDQYALAMVAYELYCDHPAFSAPSYE
ncbi:MAG: serine/threonine-protein kinase, partial [Planctomycetia bacterium]|nr:serine/threonine-protein kinase [Planctomycetia bacterium]